MGPPSATCNWHPLPGRRLPARVEAATGMGEQKENVPFVPLAYVAFYMYQSCFRCVRIANTNGMPRTPVNFPARTLPLLGRLLIITLRTLHARHYQWPGV